VLAASRQTASGWIKLPGIFSQKQGVPA
jgi:hypothetical protein